MGVVLHKPVIVLLLAQKSKPNVTSLCSYFQICNCAIWLQLCWHALYVSGFRIDRITILKHACNY